MEGKTALGASSPAKPALHIPEPLSTTRAATSSSHILVYVFLIKIKMRHKFLERSMTYVWGEMCKFFYLYQFLSLYDWPQPRVIVSRAKLLSWIHCSILVLLPGHANMQNDDEVKNSHMLIHVQRLSNDIFLGCHRWRIVCSLRNKLYVLYA